jgi:hypothetical protein
MTPFEVKSLMEQNREFWLIPFMDFVDEFRRKQELASLIEPITPGNERFDALLASTIEYLCNEAKNLPPNWVYSIPACHEPWFVSGVENLKAIAIVESPVWFRKRKIFVLANFLDRV